MVIVAVVNQKGGVAKTTTSVNLAVGLAMSGYRVLAIDLDPQAHFTLGLGMDSALVTVEETVIRLFYEEPSILERIIINTPQENVRLVPASILLALAVENLSNVNFRETKLKKALAMLDNEFDYVIMDCAPNFSVLSVNALVAANKILVPTLLSYKSLTGFGDLLKTIRSVKENDYDHDLRVLFTRVKGTGKERQGKLREILAPVSERFLNTQIRETEAIERSEMPDDEEDNVIMTVVKERPSANRGAQDYWNLVKEITEIWPAQQKD